MFELKLVSPKFRLVMKNRKDRPSDAELEDLIREAKAEADGVAGWVNYEKFLRLLTTR